MISRTALANRATLWELQHHIVERDYVIGWVLWGIGADRHLSDSWVFKGGNMPEEMLHRDPSFLPGPGLHRPARRPFRTG